MGIFRNYTITYNKIKSSFLLYHNSAQESNIILYNNYVQKTNPNIIQARTYFTKISNIILYHKTDQKSSFKLYHNSAQKSNHSPNYARTYFSIKSSPNPIWVREHILGKNQAPNRAYSENIKWAENQINNQTIKSNQINHTPQIFLDLHKEERPLSEGSRNKIAGLQLATERK